MNQLSVYDFGAQLLETNDLDPVYVTVWEAELDPETLKRWLLAYWCYYHMGTASWIVDQKDYWKAMNTAAVSSDYPRGRERRHFRAANATKSVAWLEGYGVRSLFQPLVGCDCTVDDLIDYVETWVGFGPWIAFKVADMVDRLGLGRVRFDTASVFLFDSPKEGAAEMWRRYGKGKEPESREEWAIDSILTHLGSRLTTSRAGKGYRAPPRYERDINAQEAETILCKWKSYLGGHYRLGEDTEAVWHALLRFAKTPTAQRLIRGYRKGYAHA